MSSQDGNEGEEENEKRILAQFVSESGEKRESPLELPITCTPNQLQLICNALLKQEENVPYSFFINETEITESLKETVQNENQETEKVLEIVYQPQAVFRVRPVTRCSATIPGHAESVISVAFSPDGRYLASGSGDTTVRFWDICTGTPHHTCKAHQHWVLSIAWSPEGKKLASGCKNSQICVWDPETGKQIGRTLTGHKKWITWLCWKPLHLDPNCRHLASASKDGTVKIWDVVLGKMELSLAGHTQSVTCVKWSGEDLLYTSSQDCTIKVWRPKDGVLCRTLQGHGHWVNNMALSTDYVLRTGAFEPSKATLVHKEVTDTPEELSKVALERYNLSKSVGAERLVSGSDDFTLILWKPAEDKKPLARMTGHQQLINEVLFSPDTRIIASASFDKSIKLWDGRTGKYIASLRGHVSAVYQIAWSADSRLLCSGSSDSTLKVWDVRARKLGLDLPGHADEVYAVDWSPNGQKVASGGKDKVLKLWTK